MRPESRSKQDGISIGFSVFKKNGFFQLPEKTGFSRFFPVFFEKYVFFVIN